MVALWPKAMTRVVNIQQSQERHGGKAHGKRLLMHSETLPGPLTTVISVRELLIQMKWFSLDATRQPKA